MSRETKYRAWHKSAQRMFYSSATTLDYSVREQNDRHVYSPVSFHLGTDDVERTVGYEDETPVVEDLLLLMQYTGLKDKNGIEIYEGDIVKILYTDWPSKDDNDSRTFEQYVSDLSETKIIEWRVQGFYAAHKVGGYAESMEPGTHGFIEVIGNIYENPDLVK